jgi:hypothetical protein
MSLLDLNKKDSLEKILKNQEQEKAGFGVILMINMIGRKDKDSLVL